MKKQYQTGEWRNFYGRLKGKALKPAQERYISDDLPKLSVPRVGWDENPDRAEIDLSETFEQREIWLEIGFGSGEHIVHQAKQNPNVGIIGCEPYINGVASCIGKIKADEVANIRLHAGDARDLLDVLPAGSIEKCFLLYPDPWPKARHNRRRFATQEHLVPLARALASGAVFRVATDIEDYVRQTLQEVHLNGSFDWLAEGPSDWRAPWDDWLSTRYEQKAFREGRKAHYLTFRRK